MTRLRACARVVVVTTAVALSIAALVPTSAGAGEKTDVAFVVHLIDLFGAPATSPSDQVVKTENGYAVGFIVGGGALFCCQVGAELTWTLTRDLAGGSVHGSWAISGNPDDRIWLGELHGHVTPTGVTGVITGTANTGEHLHGTWTAETVDPTSGHELVITVTGTLMS